MALNDWQSQGTEQIVLSTVDKSDILALHTVALRVPSCSHTVFRTSSGNEDFWMRFQLIGASLSEPQLHRRVCCKFSICMYRTSCRKSLPGRILRVLASCVISNLSSLPACSCVDVAPV